MSMETKDGNVTPSGKGKTQKSVTSENLQKKQVVEKHEEKKSVKKGKVKVDSNASQIPQEEKEGVKSSEGKVKDFKINKKQFIIVGIIVAVIVVLAIAFNFVKSFAGNNNYEYPLVYLTMDDEFKFISSKKKDGTLIDEKGDKISNVTFSNASDKYIMFTKDNDLYLYNTAKKDSAVKVASDVMDAYFTDNDKYIIYLDDDDNLYSYNYKDKVKLESKVDNIEMVTKDYVFFEKDENLYMRSVKASKDDKKKITSDYYSVVFNEAKTKILICKSPNGKSNKASSVNVAIDKDSEASSDYDALNDFYVYTIKSDKTEKVLDDVVSAYYDDDFTEFYYLKESKTSEFDLSIIIDDDKKETDEKFVAYSYEDVYDGKISYREYWDNADEKYEVEFRNKIRERIADYTADGGYTLYYVKGSKETKIADNVEELINYDYTSKSIAYSKISYDTNKKIKISEIEYFSDITSYINDNKKYTVEINVSGDNSYTLGDDIDEIYLINKAIYYVSDEDLFYTRVNNKTLDSPKTLGEKVWIVDATGDYKDGILFITDQKDAVGDLNFAKGEKVTKIDSDVAVSGVKIIDDNKLFYLADYDSDDYVGELRVYTGKVKKLVDEIVSYSYVNDNYIYVIKDYSTKNGSGDLYVYNGSKKLKVIDYSVVGIYTK